ncbi:MAG: carboxypeptidase-like regulatory domain-containing protein [Nitrospirota bacterium]
MGRVKFLYPLIFVFCLSNVAFGEEITTRQASSPVITLGKVYTKWKGFLNIPFWTEANISFSGITPVTLPKEATSFKFGLAWRGENETRASQKCTILTRVETETYPDSDKWVLLFEEANDLVSRVGVVDEQSLVTKSISQEKSEVKYKITVRPILAIGQEIKPNSTYITVRLTSKVYTTYTSIPIIPMTILHDPSGDGSWTAIKPETSITHLLNINLAGMEATIEDQKDLVFETPSAKIEIKSEGNETMKITMVTKEEITSSLSKDPCLIGPGIGDTYVLIKDLPVRFKFSKTFTPQGQEVKSLTFCAVTSQEAGLSPEKGFDVLLIPAGVLRSYDKNCSIFGSWEKLGLDDQMRQQLIEMNIGWDNFISEEEKSNVVDIGQGYLNFKDQTIKNYTQTDLNKVNYYSELTMEPYFATTAGVPISKDRILSAITLNNSPVNKTIHSERLSVTLEDDERQNIPGDFFTYQIYQDRLFGSLLFMTKDDRTKPATLNSLLSRSFSSSPKEYWTQDLSLIPVESLIFGLVTSPAGSGIGSVSLELMSGDEVVKKVTTKQGGSYTITGLMQGAHYTLSANIDGYEGKTLEITPFLDKELVREINIVLEKIPSKMVETPVVKEVIQPPTLPIPPKVEEEKPGLTPPPPSKEEIPNLLINSNFSAGLKAWKVVKTGVGKEMSAKVIKNDFTYPYALEIKRTGSMQKKGEIVVGQELNKDVFEYTQLVLKADVKVIDSSLQSDGKGGGVYPVAIQIDYLDAGGKVNSWRHGFLYTPKINYPKIGERIPKDKWFTYISPNLLEIKPKLKVIKGIKLSGSGWGFHGRIADVQLAWSKEPPATKEETPVTKPEELSEKVVEKVPSLLPKPEVSQPVPPAPKEKVANLLTNGNFSTGLKGWKLVKVGAGKEMSAWAIKSDFTYSHALEIKRTGSNRITGEMGVVQRLNKDVSNYAQLILQADVKVIDSSLGSDGKKGGLYPLAIQIDYTDANDKPHSWRHGFLYTEKINYPAIGEKVPQDKWQSYTSPNLMELIPKPKMIKEIKLSGNGWGFHSRMANVQLISQETPTP